MIETGRIGLQVSAALCFVVGLLIFLNSVQSSGEAPQTFRLFVEFTELTGLGIALMVISLAAVAWLFFEGRKKSEDKGHA